MIFTVIKQNDNLTRHFGPICIYFDNFPPYTDAISDYIYILMYILSAFVDILIQITNIP